MNWLYGKMGRIMNGLATKKWGTLPTTDRTGLRCRWVMTGGTLRAVWEVR